MTDKTLEVRLSDDMPGCYEAFYEGGGELPDVLKDAYFTNPTIAEREIQTYLTTGKRGVKSGNRSNQSRTD